jgi:hypothetical protein
VARLIRLASVMCLVAACGPSTGGGGDDDDDDDDGPGPDAGPPCDAAVCFRWLADPPPPPPPVEGEPVVLEYDE